MLYYDSVEKITVGNIVETVETLNIQIKPFTYNHFSIGDR